jgi:hypothetical protein
MAQGSRSFEIRVLCFAPRQKGKPWVNPSGSAVRVFQKIIIFIRKKWRAQGDDFRTFLGDFVAALPQIDFPVGLSL